MFYQNELKLNLKTLNDPMCSRNLSVDVCALATKSAVRLTKNLVDDKMTWVMMFQKETKKGGC
jgi:hypothetical protein